MATFTVTTTVDELDAVPTDGAGLSLREAVALANASGGADVIDFAATVNGTIMLGALGQLELSDDVTIDATVNSNTITVSAAGFDHRVFETSGPNSSSGTTAVILNGFSIDQGSAVGADATDGEAGGSAGGEGGGGGGGGGAGLGGGLFVGADTDVTLIDITFFGNSADGGDGGNGGSGTSGTNGDPGLGGDPNGGDGGGGSTSSGDPGDPAPASGLDGPGYGGGGGGGGGGHGAVIEGPAATAGGAGADGGFGAGSGGGGGVGPAIGGEGGGGGGGGGGGAGLGGAIFVEQGGTLTYRPGNVSGSAVSGGSGGNGGTSFGGSGGLGGAGAESSGTGGSGSSGIGGGGGGGGGGAAFGAGIFIQGTNTIVLSPGDGDTLKIYDEISDEQGSTNSGGTGSVLVGGDPTTLDGGTVHLVNNHTYTGNTTVREGTLILGDQGAVGSPTGHIDNSDVTVESGGTLGGNGSTDALTVLDGGTLAPGESAGIITVTSLTLAAGATFEVEIGGFSPGPGGYDQVIVQDDPDGPVSLDGADLDVTLTAPLFPLPGDSGTFIIIANDETDPVNGTFAGKADESNFIVGDRTFSIDYQGGDGNDVELKLLGISLVKKTNGSDNNAPTGPELLVGSTATFTYEVTNTTAISIGEGPPIGIPLTNVVVTDDNGTPGNTADDFNPTFDTTSDDGDGILELGETWRYTATRIVTAGQYTNTACVTASIPLPEFPTDQVSLFTLNGEGAFEDKDVDNHFGITPGGEGCQELFLGTNASEVLPGNECDNTVIGFAGNDVLFGLGGNDHVRGGTGNDRLLGNDGRDILTGEAGNDRLDGNDGNDSGFGGTGNDLVTGGDGNDRLFGEAGNDRLDGGDGNDRLDGGEGADPLEGEAGNDILVGGNGNDRLEGQAGNDALLGGAGNDRLRGGTQSDALDGGAGHDFMLGEEGIDVLHGRAGNDRLQGGLAADLVFGGDGADRFELIAVNDSGPAVGAADRFLDFDFGEGDRIRLTAIDADQTTAANDAFVFIGTAAFSDAGQVRFQVVGGETRVFLNTDNDTAAEAMVRVDGVHAMASNWFNL
jgi:Ca2+-binding RTX toxin-like protein